ncbi:MAG: PQQ-like beta-propeller repeat protein [Planctomycetes bacterium]|nr:PQQ-like beta-propeller repeat protein [Planctomycetota bacterium]
MSLHSLFFLTLVLAQADAPAAADDIDRKYPLGDQLRVLAEDAASPAYYKLVTEEMLSTDLAAEWQRVETLDNAESFIEKHGGQERVMADTDLKRAWQRRVDIRNQFLEVMRAGFRRYKLEPPFDRGEKAERAGTAAGRVTQPVADLAVVYPSPGAERNWPRFRGPDGQGGTGLSKLPVRWSESENIVWRTALPGSGNSSPVVWADQVFLTSAGPEGADRMLHCVRTTDGQLLWSRTIPENHVEPKVRDKNGFASGTPVTDGERVIAFFGAAGLVAFDMQGSFLWQHTFANFDTTHGAGASPLLYKDSVIFIHDQNKGESICLALDKRTGKMVWQTPRGKVMGWSTPVIVRVGDHDELLYAGGETVKGYDPNTGAELWSLDGPTREVVPAIVIGPDVVYSASGRNGPTLAIRPGGQGDVTATHLAWRAVRGGPHVPSPILYGGCLYTVNDTGIGSCLDAKTGETIWQARIRDKFSASPIEAGGLLYFPSESGVTYVLRAGDKFEIVAENDLGSPILASPAIAAGRLLLRTQAELVCIDEKTERGTLAP